MIKHEPPETTVPDRPAERVSAQVIALDLASKLAALRDSAAYRRNDHASTTLVNRPGMGAVLVALPKGGHLKEHRTARPITVHVIEGRVSLDLRDRTIEMQKGDVTALGPSLPHTVTGLEDSAFLITIGGSPVEPAGGR